MSIGPPNPEIRMSQFDLENQRVKGKWPWCCTHTGLDNSIELEWYKSILWFQRYVFCNVWAKCCQLLQVFGPWASPYGANGQITITLHNYRSRQFHRTSSGENSSSGYREMGSASLAGARPAAGPPARAVVTIPLQPGRLRGNKANLGDFIANKKIINSSARVTLNFDVWPWKTIGRLFYATSSFVQHFVPIGEFKLELQLGNAQSGSNSTIFRAVWPWNLTDDLEKQYGTSPKQHQAICIVSLSYKNSNWSYSPETVKLGRDTCGLDL